jgi:phospholipid/cholesterol/gamma-HCH transport system substrate-binding protein
MLRTRPLALGTALAAVLLGLTVIALLSTNGIPGLPRYQLVTTLPPDAAPLREGAEVRVGGLVMGLVSHITPTDQGQRVVFSLKGAAQPVGRDARITVRLRSPAGQHYLAIDRGSFQRDPLPNGGEIPPSQVQRTEDLLDVVQGFRRTALADLATTVRFTGFGLASQGVPLNTDLAGLDVTLRQLTGVLQAVTPGNDLPGMLRSADLTARGFAGAQPDDTGRLTTASARTFDAFGRSAASIGAGLRELRPAEDEILRTLPTADPIITQAGRLAVQLKPAVRALRRALPDASALFAEGPTLARESGRLAAAAVPPLQRLAPIAKAFSPSALMVGLAAGPLGPLASYLSEFGPELESGFAAFYSALNYLNAAGLAPDTPAAPVMLIFTCARGSDTDPRPGQLFRDRMAKTCQ